MKRVGCILFMLSMMFTLAVFPDYSITTYQVTAPNGSDGAQTLTNGCVALTMCNTGSYGIWVHFGSGAVDTVNDLYLDAGACTPTFNAEITRVAVQGDGGASNLQLVVIYRT